MESKVFPETSLKKQQSVAEISLPDESEKADDERRRAHAFNPNASLKVFLSSTANRREEQQRAANIRRADIAARNVFKTFDLNGDGTIAVSELNNLAEALERQKILSRSAIAQMLEQYTKDGDMELSFRDFKKFFHHYNQVRLAEQRRESLVMREHLSGLHDAITVSSSKKCSRMCLGTIKTGCCVYHKQLLIIAAMAAMTAMVPLLGTAYTTDFATVNGYAFAIIWSNYWAFYPSWSIICYYYAYPKRQPVWLLVLLAIIYGGIGLASASGLACPHAIWYTRFRSPTTAPFSYKMWRTVLVSLEATINFVLLFLYRGPVRFKGLFIFAICLMFMVPVPSYLHFWTGWEMVKAGLSAAMIVATIVAIRITECLHKRKGGKRIGGSRAYTAIVALLLPHLVPAFVVLMYFTFRDFVWSPSISILMYLLFLLIKLQVRDAMAIAVSSSLMEDIPTIILMFFPIFSFQFITELVLISVSSPNTFPRFIAFLFIKLITSSLTKGGFLMHWATSLENWTRRRRKRHQVRKMFLKGIDKSRSTSEAMFEDNSDGDLLSSTTHSVRDLFKERPTTPIVQKVKREIACRQVELNCLWVLRQFIKILFSFLSNTSGQTLHEFEGSEHQRMVESTVVIFTLISMSNISSLACNLGVMVVLFIEQLLPESERVWFIGMQDHEWGWTHLNFAMVLAANIFIIFLSNWTKYSRWSKLQVLLKLHQLSQHDPTSTQSRTVRKAKAKLLHKLYRQKADNESTDRKKSLRFANLVTRASSDEMVVEAEYHGNKLYKLERKVFQKYFWLLLLITIYSTFVCASYGADDKYFVWLKKKMNMGGCNWTLLISGATFPSPGLQFWANAPMCGTGDLPNLNCTHTCAEAYPNSSYWARNCSLYD